jgi:hypothetical protein
MNNRVYIVYASLELFYYFITRKNAAYVVRQLVDCMQEFGWFYASDILYLFNSLQL